MERNRPNEDPGLRLGMPTVRALVLVDLQTAFVTGKNAVPRAQTLMAAITGLLTRARATGALVVHLQTTARQEQPMGVASPAGHCS